MSATNRQGVIMWTVEAINGERFIIWDWVELMELVRQGVRGVWETRS